MANVVSSGSINDNGVTFQVDALGRVLGVRIVGDFEGIVSFEGQHEGDAGWTAVGLPSMGGTGESPTFTTVAADFRGAVPYMRFRCIGSEWVSGTAFIHVTTEEPVIAEPKAEDKAYFVLADDVVEASIGTGVYLGMMPRSYAVVTVVKDGTPDTGTYDADIEGSIDGSVWTYLATPELTPDDVTAGGVLTTFTLPNPWFTWARVHVNTLDADGGDDPTMKYILQANR